MILSLIKCCLSLYYGAKVKNIIKTSNYYIINMKCNLKLS